MLQSTVRVDVRPRARKREIGKYTMAVTVALTRVEAHRIRRFEQAGLLAPARTVAGQRLFSDSEIELIKEIGRLENKGINLKGVKAILAIKRGAKV